MIVVVAWWLRTRIVRRQFAAVLAERARVSREIHDTLLQGVLGISLHLDHLEHALPSGDENRRRFERLRLQDERLQLQPSEHPGGRLRLGEPQPAAQLV